MSQFPDIYGSEEIGDIARRLERSRRHARMHSILCVGMVATMCARIFARGAVETSLEILGTLLITVLCVSVLRDMSGTLLGIPSDTTPYPRTMRRGTAIAFQMLIIALLGLSVWSALTMS